MKLNGLNTVDSLRELAASWGYSRPSISEFPFRLPEIIKSNVTECRTIGEHQGFRIVYIKVDEAKKNPNQTVEGFMRVTEREFIKNIPKSNRPENLYVFTDQSMMRTHFVNATDSSQISLRRFSINPETKMRLHTAQEQLSKLSVNEGDSLQDLITKNQKAFDVEEVTNNFFKVFGIKFIELMEFLKRSGYSQEFKVLSDVTQVIMNRVLFLKFIEKKGWLDENTDYLSEKFQPYFDSKDLYWNDVLVPLFSKLSDNNFSDPSLGDIPFLNGGLFGKKPEGLDRVSVPNDFFANFFGEILNKYNFTIDESTPLSTEVAVDPEMLGRIFESLVLAIEKSPDDKIEEDIRKATNRRATGSYYTPRIVVFHMVRNAIARKLGKDIDQVKIRKIIDMAIDDTPDVNQLKNIEISKPEARGLLNAISKLSICDPAVGSGAYLLIALQILVGLIKILELYTDGHTDDPYNTKETVIKNNLIGVDILPQAVHICELRLWLSLVVDHKDKGPKPTLPNLTYRIFRGDSINDHLLGQKLQLDTFRPNMTNVIGDSQLVQDLERLKSLKVQFFDVNDESKKMNLRNEIYKKKLDIAVKILQEEHSAFEQKEQLGLIDSELPKQEALVVKLSKENREFLYRIKQIIQKESFEQLENGKLDFVWLIDLVEFFVDHGKGGFDIIIGNPPYGIKIDERSRYGLESKDSYGVFIALALDELLKDGGILSFITSDTWQTIKSHKPLREKLLNSALVHELLMMPSWTFDATVNTSILTVTKNKGYVGFGHDVSGHEVRDKNEIIACDFTCANRRSSDIEEYLHTLDDPKFYSTGKAAFYIYSQGLIKNNSNIPFFVGSPKIFKLINDVTCKKIDKEVGNLDKRKVTIQFVDFNQRIVEVVKLGDISSIKHGLTTGKTKEFIFKDPEESGNYPIVDNSLVLSEEDYELLDQDEMKNGINPDKFGGRYIIRYDKGGGSDTDEAWLPKYFVPTHYYINWSRDGVNRMKALPGFRHDGKEFYFKEGVTFSHTGVYSPTFRFNSRSVFDTAGSSLFTASYSLENLIGILNSKLILYLFKTYINHTVNASEDPLKALPIIPQIPNNIGTLVKAITLRQQESPRYNYQDNEQKQIDHIVYASYCLDEEDTIEVENWAERRYPKLAGTSKRGII